MMLCVPRLLAASALVGVLSAQTLTVPAAAAATEGNSSTGYPLDIANGRFIYIYDSTHFTANGITFPILITQISYRANGATATWAGAAPNVQVDLSTSPLDFLAISTTWDNNHGVDRATVFNGPLTIPAGSSTTGQLGPFFASIPFAQAFLYDPSQGDLAIDTTTLGGSTAGTPSHDCVTTAGVANARRVFSVTNPPAATGTFTTGEIADVIEFTYTPAAGLYAGFTADVTSGTSPLAVNFTDQSFSSAPGGVQTWAWDFDGDNVTDSTAQNPSFVYTGCGDFTVSLTVTDSQHAPSTFTRTAYVATDSITAGFTYVLATPPNVFQFTDTSTPAATAWAWDFDNDGIVDSTLQNPTATLPLCAASAVKLTATRNCRSDDVIQSLFLSPTNLTTLTNGTAGGASFAGFFDVAVTNPQGINICAMEHNTGPAAVGTPYSVNVYVTDATYVGKNQLPAAWRLATTGTGTAAGTGVPSATPFTSPLYLASGNYGLLIEYVGFQPRYSNTGGAVPTSYSDANLTLFAGAFQNNAFSGTLFGAGARMWYGIIHYDTASLAGTAGYGFFAPGCAGSLGVTNLLHQNRPQLGQTLDVDLNNLPLSAAIVMTGFSNTTSGFGALPLDLTGFGAPGCFGRVSPDATLFLFGAANSATWSFGVPNAPFFLGLVMYNQALVLDPGFNALGAVASDAAGFMLGN
jgi:PKD repeat protein